MNPSGTPYWWTTAPALAVPEAPLPARTDVAIVGGGYTGLAAAREIAIRGGRVCLLEAETVGWGASSRNGGQVLTGLPIDAGTLIHRYGRQAARAWFAWALEAIDALERLIADEAIDCEFVRCGHIEAAAKPSHFDAARHERDLLAREFGHEVRILPPADAALELGSEGYCGLVVDDRSARLHPARYVRGLARAAVRAGAGLHERTRVRRIEPDGAALRVETDRGVLRAAEVIVATNGYTGPAVPDLRRRLVAIGSYMIATAPIPADVALRLIPRRRVVYDSWNLLHYFHLAPDGRLLFGGRATFATPSPRALRRSAARLHADLVRIFPALAGVPVESAWGGQVGIARDRLPHAGRLGRWHYAAGYAGQGIAPATALGRALARRLMGEAPEDPPFTLPCPAIPLYRGRPWFLPAVGAWYGLRDRLS
ncbi:MAG: FAD-binding oxidoreductase [Acidobacteriota bacterium]|nr:FAD-binding oxidoreductase [Acidobacteriota bacterium]